MYLFNLNFIFYIMYFFLTYTISYNIFLIKKLIMILKANLNKKILKIIS